MANKKCRYDQAIQIKPINGVLTVLKSAGCRCGWKSDNINDDYDVQKVEWVEHRVNLLQTNTPQTTETQNQQNSSRR